MIQNTDRIKHLLQHADRTAKNTGRLDVETIDMIDTLEEVRNTILGNFEIVEAIDESSGNYKYASGVIMDSLYRCADSLSPVIDGLRQMQA